MRIQHNIPALSAYRNYSRNVSMVNKNLEKLSSGYKINRAGDDAAGLAISEKMRIQISGLEQAQNNAKSGINLVQTAEGALTEVHDMLNRMYTLAEQSANGTYSDDVDREQLQKEVNSLRTEIDRIADATNYNGINLLDGSLTQRSAGSKDVTVTGMDRIIKTTMGKGEAPYEVAGAKTILDAYGNAAPVQGEIKINLKDLTISKVKGTGATVATKTGIFDLKIGDATVSLIVGSTAIASGTKAAAAILAKAKVVVAGKTLATKGATSTVEDGVITINGVRWGGTYAAGVLNLKMLDAPKTESQCKTNFDVKVLNPNTAAFNVGNDTNVGVQTTTVAKAKGALTGANTVFRIDKSDIVDGAEITIGSKTVTLKVGATSTTTGANLVDLSYMDPDDIDLNQALAEISKTFGATAIKVKGTNAKGSSSDINFLVGVNDGTNGGPVGLTIQRQTAPANADGVRFDTVEKLAAAFKLEKTETWKAQTGLILQIGDTPDEFNKLAVSIKDMHASGMGIDEIDISTQEGASAAMTAIKNATNYVSDVRGDLGALQNRLDHTINNLSVTQENITDAESTIRDVDIAKEMMAYTKNNILVQSAQAMLAQANQLPQGVLQLLG